MNCVCVTSFQYFQNHKYSKIIKEDTIKATVRKFDPRLLTVAEGRRALTKSDPLLFALIYLPHHITNSNGEKTLSDFHLDILEYAKSWMNDSGKVKAKSYRDAFLAPRQSGKSTWTFTILPLWAAAHGHKKFIAAFADSETQAMGHLNTFKTELDTNEKLRADFPELCTPKKMTTTGRFLAQNRNQIIQENGFVFMAKGADSAALGMKVGAMRPDVILFDDIEPGESNYSANEAAKRKETLLSDLLPLNTWAHVAFVGTTTMPNSIMDQIRKAGELIQQYEGEEEYLREFLDPELRWVVDENIKVHYWPAIINDGGVEKSLWPETWPIEELQKDRHTRSFAKNMMNRPISTEGGYWDEADIDVDLPESFGNTILVVDPAVTTAKRSDYTGIAVVSRGSDGKIYIRHAEQIKKDSEHLREHVKNVAEEYGVGMILIENNQGGDLWRQVFKDIGYRLRLKPTRESKEVRAATAFDHYKRGKVKHTRHFPALEEQMLAFPKVPHDDVLDAVVAGVLYFKNSKGGGFAVAQTNYLEAS